MAKDLMTPFHPLDRPGQQAAYNRIAQSDKKFIVCRLATGTGKTALAAQLACDGHKTLAVVATKSLQQQYKKYSFFDLYGKSNYACKEVGQQFNMFQKKTADLCECPKDSKGACNIVCDYPRARAEFVKSQAGIINYAKFVSDRSVVTSTDYVCGFDPEYLVLDEAHELSDLVVNTCGFSRSWKDKRLMDNCSEIEIDIDRIDYPLPVARRMVNEMAMDWLSGLEWTLKKNTPKRPSDRGVTEWRWYKRMIDNVSVTLEAMKWGENDWYCYADEYGITIKPLTSKYHFQPLFNRAEKIVMMSATIQMSDVISLGLRFEDVEFISMPSPFRAQDRPVYDLKGPKITAHSSLEDRKEHAKVIGNCLTSFENWNSIVHVPSKLMAAELGERLNKYRPVWIPAENTSTDEAMDSWQEFNSQNEGACAVAWQFMTGVDMGDVAINITARVPYPNFGEKFEKERFDYSPRQAMIRVSNLIEQQQGRNRRGFEGHYGEGAKKFNGLADAKWAKLKNMMDYDFRKSIIG